MGNETLNLGRLLRPSIDIDDAVRLAQIATRAGAGGSESENALKILAGRELGIMPMQSLINIAVVRGRPFLFGDAIPGLIVQSPYCGVLDGEYVGEIGTDSYGYRVKMIRVKGSDPEKVVRTGELTFTVGDAKKAGLWQSTEPWKKYPNVMLRRKAVSQLGRDIFPDVLCGFGMVEESHEYFPEPQPKPTVTVITPPAVVDQRREESPSTVIPSPPAKVEIHDMVMRTPPPGGAIEMATANQLKDLSGLLSTYWTVIGKPSSEGVAEWKKYLIDTYGVDKARGLTSAQADYEIDRIRLKTEEKSPF